jgi:hypothetical protein
MQFHLIMDALGQSFDGDDVLSSGALGRIDTGDNRIAIDQYGTRAAFSLLASDLGSRQTKSQPEKGSKCFARFCFESLLDAIYGKGNLFCHKFFLMFF